MQSEHSKSDESTGEETGKPMSALPFIDKSVKKLKSRIYKYIPLEEILYWTTYLETISWAVSESKFWGPFAEQSVVNLYPCIQ